MKLENKTADAEHAAAEPEYTKQQALASQKYAHRRDLIGALLEDGKTYALTKVDAMIKDFDERKM
jgi:hypothetical protein